tara:strand:+ start:2554 stop:2679 length:126 start_codon:yes stop_codon:yes gene_type:complete
MGTFLNVCNNVIDFILGKKVVAKTKVDKPKRRYTRRKQKSK